MNSNYYAVIMAGGIGSRFWPVSTTQYPKQFHDMLGTGQTLLQRTYGRLQKFIPAENILILTNEQYKGIVEEQIPHIQPQNLVLEPCMRNTAPCIAYAAMKINKRNPDAVMIVAPSDAWIEDENAFKNDVITCFEAAQNNPHILTLGIKPTFPNTGYGYIQHAHNDVNTIKKVLQFREKPNYETAKTFVQEGNFLWNAGIFVWSTHTVLAAYKKYQPEMYDLFSRGENVYNTPEEPDFITEAYPLAENISVDYAILEPSPNIYVLPASFNWNDLGSWGSLYDKTEKDEQQNAVINAYTLLRNAQNNIIRTQNKKYIIIEDLSDYIIVDRDDVLLIYPKAKEQHIKEVAAEVKNKWGLH